MGTNVDKARLGAIGENNVVSILMQHDWDAFNANCSIKNFKSIDVICLNSDPCVKGISWKPDVALIQVKTSVQSNIPIGFTIGQCLDREYLEKNVMGPYVFISAKISPDYKYSFSYFIISRKDFIELAYQAHVYYVRGYERLAGKLPLNTAHRENGVDLNSPAGFKIKWLQGESEEKTDTHSEFCNPLNGVSGENQWNNIWKD